MERTLRGHHLLCVHGFQGMGYSPEFIVKMGEIVEDIRNDDKDFSIRVVASLDDTCSACPHNGGTICVASPGSNDQVTSMDEKVIKHLQLETGRLYQKSKLIELTATMVSSIDLDYLCKDCSWLSYGVCKDGIEKLKQQKDKSVTTLTKQS